MGTSFLGIGISTLCPSHTEAFKAKTLCIHFQRTEMGPAVHSIGTLPATTFSAPWPTKQVSGHESCVGSARTAPSTESGGGYIAEPLLWSSQIFESGLVMK